jgi:protocatechuate 3,4-dioxygenase beta subunit
MFVEGVVTDVQGKPIPNAIIDTWETDGHGQYDTQYDNREFPDCRGRLRSTEDGSYAFRAVVPVSYPIPGDGTVGRMMSVLGRHIYRPAHLHIQIAAPGYETLITSLFFKGDPYLTSDAVFGVKSSLIEVSTFGFGRRLITNNDGHFQEPVTMTDLALSKQRGFKEAKPHAYLKRDFVLATNEQGAEARELVKQTNADRHK